jgi:hypothetical protein
MTTQPDFYQTGGTPMGANTGGGGGGSGGGGGIGSPGSSAGSGKALVEAFLAGYGLPVSLVNWAWDLYTGKTDGRPHSLPEIALLLPATKEFMDRFPAYADVIKFNPQFTAADYIQYELDVRQMIGLYRLPAGMYDDAEGIASLLRNNVSGQEFELRIGLAANAAYNAPQDVRDAAAELGVSLGDLVGYYADPDKALPLLQRQWAQAQVMGAARTQRVGVAAEQAERLALQGVEYGAALEGFGRVYAARDLSADLIGEGEEGIDTPDLIGAQFGEAVQADRARNIAARRAASYQGQQGGAVASGTGVSGAGSAST